jgi:1-acyl-sn-glycerol-3-phosphate acyltransferase
VFPEGVPGIGKPFSKRYQLQEWRVGHVELGIRHGAPIVPVAVIGAEEQMPQLGRLEGLNLFGAPYLPIPATPVPLPVRYRIYYGPPVDIPARYPREAADDPHRVADAAAEVRDAVQDLIERGLRERDGIFR